MKRRSARTGGATPTVSDSVKVPRSSRWADGLHRRALAVLDEVELGLPCVWRKKV
jgi:hypothetical protein